MDHAPLKLLETVKHATEDKRFFLSEHLLNVGSGKQIHHWKYPIQKNPAHAIDPNNLVVTAKKPLSVGTKNPGHTQIHQAIGGKGLNTRAGMYSKMAWGKETAIQRDYSFSNPGDRVPLGAVKGLIKAFNRGSSQPRMSQKAMPKMQQSVPTDRMTRQPLAIDQRSVSGKVTVPPGKTSTAKPIATLSVTNKLGSAGHITSLRAHGIGNGAKLHRSLGGPLR